jgi:hypothetical protein
MFLQQLCALFLLDPQSRSSGAPEQKYAVRISQILGAQYEERSQQLYLLASQEEGRLCTLHVDDVVVMTTAALRVLAMQQDWFFFTLEPGVSGKRMEPHYIPTELEAVFMPQGRATRPALVSLEADLILKNQATARGSKQWPSEIDLLAEQIHRRVSSGQPVKDVAGEIHRLFFALETNTFKSADWLNIAFPNPRVHVLLPKDEMEKETGDELLAERQFASVMETVFNQVLADPGRSGENCRALRNLLLLSRIIGWTQDIDVPINAEALAAYQVSAQPLPLIPSRMVRRRVPVSDNRQVRVQLAGGVVFNVAERPRLRPAVSHSGAAVRLLPVSHTRRQLQPSRPRIINPVREVTIRSPPPFLVEQVVTNEQTICRINVTSLVTGSIQ